MKAQLDRKIKLQGNTRPEITEKTLHYPIDWVQVELLAKLPPNQRIFVSLQKAEMLRADLRSKLMENFPNLIMSEINMKVLRSLTPVRIGKSYTEPAYHEHFS